MQTGSFMTLFFLILVYTVGLIKFTMLCYNVSFVLPDKVLQWLGAGFGDVAAFGTAGDFGDSMKLDKAPGGGGNTAHNFASSITKTSASSEKASESSEGLSRPPSFQQAAGFSREMDVSPGSPSFQSSTKALDGRLYEGDFTRIEPNKD